VNDPVIEVTAKFFEYYDELPREIKKKFKKQLSYPAHNPKHQSLQILQIEGSEYWEFYVDRGYRCVFKRQGNGRYELHYVGTHELIDEF
jgi:mRNA-degrading endonuclease RelE of RelBE toxin-antitoxin system